VLDEKIVEIIKTHCFHPYWEKCGGLNSCEYFKDGDCKFDINEFIKELRQRGKEK
jgi:hypothetical protein